MEVKKEEPNSRSNQQQGNNKHEYWGKIDKNTGRRIRSNSENRVEKKNHPNTK